MSLLRSHITAQKLATSATQRHDLPHIFDRCGLAAQSDLRTDQWQDVFSLLELRQAEFLAKQHLFRSPEYIWPLDPLHTWSRCWEYPYVYHHISYWRAKLELGANSTVADIGSGVTFFPFSVARLGCNVICVDDDPICENDLVRAKEHVLTRPGAVSFRRTDGFQLPFRDAECGAVYCVSVLEHIPQFPMTVREIILVLEPGDLFLLTIDLDLQGNQQIRVGEYRELMACLHAHFEFVCPEVTVHPADVLFNTTGPCAMYQPNSWETLKHLAKQQIKRILGRPSRPQYDYYLAVEGFILRKP